MTIETSKVQYVCITTNQSYTKSNPSPNRNPNPASKQHAIVNIQLNVVTCSTCPHKVIRGSVVAGFVPLFHSNCHAGARGRNGQVGQLHQLRLSLSQWYTTAPWCTETIDRRILTRAEKTAENSFDAMRFCCGTASITSQLPRQRYTFICIFSSLLEASITIDCDTRIGAQIFLPHKVLGNFSTNPSTCSTSPLATANAPPVFALFSYYPLPTSKMSESCDLRVETR